MFLFHAQTIPEVIEIFVQVYCLGLYRNDQLPYAGLEIKKNVWSQICV